MSGVDVTTAILTILGALMVALGLFGGPHLAVMTLGLAALVASGALGIAASRHSN